MSLNAGTRLGPYEILAPLGAGGMGEVYRARDTRLGREVAVKVLPQHLSSSPEVRARFEREARTVSSLNHPSICTLHDIGREGDTDYLVMELIEGETLGARIARGPLPVSDVLKLGAQIADALDRAHRAGVVHRDLKPGNVMLTKSGAKLMDFGLARATGMAGPGSGSGVTMAALTQSPTIAQPLTAEGTIVGTFQYMSPEQLEGHETDTRSDIWALGCVIYEMTTGKRAFEGKSQASLIGAIMNSEPAPMSQLAPLSPPALERLVRQCLARDANERWQSAGDVRRELEWIAGSSSQFTAPVVKRRRNLRRSAAGWIAAGVIAVLAAAYILGPGRPREPEQSLVRFIVEAPPATTLPGAAEMALSPDGTLFAFVAIDSSRVSHIYLRSLAAPEARMLPGTDKASLPFWSPDGRYLAFFADGKLRKIAADGASAATVLCDAPDARGGAWSNEGVILFAPSNQGPISRVSANGGASTPVTRLAEHERGHRYPQFLPDQKHFLYVAVGASEDASTFVASIDGGDAREILKAGTKGYWTPGYLLYLDAGVNAVQRRLLARRFDAQTMQLAADAQLVLDPVNASNFGYPNVAADPRGTLVVQHSTIQRSRVHWRDRHGTLEQSMPRLFSSAGAFSLSRDGTRLAIPGADPLDIFLLDIKSDVSTRLTFANKRVNGVVWSPDGKRVAFSRLSAEAGWQLYTKSADGTGPDSLLFHAAGLFAYATDWSADGRWLVARCSDPNGDFDFWKIPMDGKGAPSLYQHTPELELGAALSPDGKWLAYVAREGDQAGLYVQSFPNPGSKYQVTIDHPVAVGWRGATLFVVTEDRTVNEIELSTDGGFRQGRTERLFRLGPREGIAGGTPDGKAFVTFEAEDPSNISRLEVVLNWTKLLDQGN